MSRAVIVDNAEKFYGDFKALKGVSTHIKPGEFFTLLGPSGCGKTTLLRMIAGFNTVDGGTISFDDKVINNIDAHKRDIGMVFQNYAIFPHLTVFDNVAYGLKAKKVSKDLIEGKVLEALKLVQIENLKDRRPNELSGGQQQRVALARAFVIEPAILLMDEPLSNLDAKLRVQMRTIIKKLQRNLGITTIYVTHDQEEALAISDRIAVMSQGEIMQIGTPMEIYMKPANPFVANFIGISNFIEGEIDATDPKNAVVTTADGYKFTTSVQTSYKGKVKISARPEQMLFANEGMKGKVTLATFLGDFVEYEVTLEDGEVMQINEYMKDESPIQEDGKSVFVNFVKSKISIYNDATGEVL